MRRGVFRDVEELVMAIGDYVDQHNEQPKPFIWTASAKDILAKVARGAICTGHPLRFQPHYTSSRPCHSR